MAYIVFKNLKIQTPGGVATCNAECASDHEGNAAFAVFGRTKDDQNLLGLYRAEVINQTQERFQKETGQTVREPSLFVDRGAEKLEGTKAEFGPDGKATRAVADYGDSMKPQAVSDLMQQQHDKDWAHQMDLTQHSISRGVDR